jgi:hypothetical protein
MSVLGTLVTPWNAAVALVLVVLYVLWQATKEFGKWEKKGLFSIKPLVSKVVVLRSFFESYF